MAFFVYFSPSQPLFMAEMFTCPIFTGKNPTEEYLDKMIGQAPGPINFTMFLTLFGERLQGTDPEDVIKNAFGCFDEDGTGMSDHTWLFCDPITH